jgi:phage shock protein PspC (stress-responsive transcriptional regulator)
VAVSAQIDYTTVALIASVSGFFGAFGTEFAKYLIQKLRDSVEGENTNEGSM